VALDGDEWLTSRFGCSTTSEINSEQIVFEAGLSPEIIWAFWMEKNIFFLMGLEPWIIQPAA
jgi:hypothetical protein